jgi:hypothetical protein
MEGMMRIGPQMKRAVWIVRNNPGCSKLFVAKQLFPRSPTYFGYCPVNRAIKAGLIKFKIHSGRYQLFVDE